MDGKSASETDTYGCTFRYGFKGSFAEVATHVCSEEGGAGAGDSMFENKHVREQEEGNIDEPGGRRLSDMEAEVSRKETLEVQRQERFSRILKVPSRSQK